MIEAPRARGDHRRLLDYVLRYPAPLLASLGCLLLGTPAESFHPLVWQYVVDEAILGERPELVLPAAAVMLLVFVAGNLLQAVRAWLVLDLSHRVVRDLRLDVHRQLLTRGRGLRERFGVGDLLERGIGDPGRVAGVLQQGLGTFLPHALQVVWICGVLVWIHPELAAISVPPFALMILVVRVLNPRVLEANHRVRERWGRVVQAFQEHLQGLDVIQSFARESEVQGRLARIHDEHLGALRSADLRGAFYRPTSACFGFLANVAVIVVGAQRIAQGELTLGGLVAFRAYWWALFAPLVSLAQANEVLLRGQASLHRIFELYDLSEAPPPPASPPAEVEGHLRFEAVSFRYPDRKALFLGLDLEVPAETNLGVVGPSGVGKTSLLSLVMGFEVPDHGRVFLDGTDLRRHDLQSVRRSIGLVGQEPFLFATTIRENIRFGDLDATDEEMERAARRAHVDAFVRDLPEGYDTVLGDRGARLSGGQRQRLCIARAFLADPRILLLDEPTAGVEPEGEAILRSAIQALLPGRTAVILSHKMAMVRGCDQIVVLGSGGVRERGTHRELMALRGWYARMVWLQGLGAPMGDHEPEASCNSRRDRGTEKQEGAG